MPMLEVLRKFKMRGQSMKPGALFKAKDRDAKLLIATGFAGLYHAPQYSAPQTYQTRTLTAEAPAAATVVVASDPSALTSPTSEGSAKLTYDMSELTKLELQTMLTTRGIEWKHAEPKADLIAKLQAHTPAPEGE